MKRFILTALATALFSHTLWANDNLPTIEAEMTHAPQVPAPLNRDHEAKVVVKMKVEEKVMPLADGVDYKYWTFDGDVPARMIRVREGDLVEVQLSNPLSSTMAHNVDFHAATGTGGGSSASLTSPGETSTFQFKALKSGLFIYHCAVAPMGEHMANGMYGLILVEPKEGLPKVDKEFYIVQGEFYTKGKFGEKGLQAFDSQKAWDERPEYVVFNGHYGALTGKNALKAKVGETVRLFVGNAGPNLVSSFHVVGEHLDKVRVEGGSLVNENVQTTLIPAGGATIAELKLDTAGRYTLVDHSIMRVEKGAVGQIVAEGEKNPQIITETLSLEPYDDGSKEATEEHKHKHH